VKKETAWFDFLQNPKSIAVKKFMAQILESRYTSYDDLLSRLTTELVTDNDINTFAKLVNDIYEIGYKKAVEDYKEQLSRFGIQVTFANPKNQGGSQ
jgi:hypothetical protein